MHLLYKWISIEIYKWYLLHGLIYLFDVMLQTVSTKMLKDEAACVQLMWAREAGRRSCWNVCITQDARALIHPWNKIRDPAGIRTQDLLNTSHTLLPLSHFGPWQRSGRQAT